MSDLETKLHEIQALIEQRTGKPTQSVREDQQSDVVVSRVLLPEVAVAEQELVPNEAPLDEPASRPQEVARIEICGADDNHTMAPSSCSDTTMESSPSLLLPPHLHIRDDHSSFGSPSLVNGHSLNHHQHDEGRHLGDSVNADPTDQPEQT